MKHRHKKHGRRPGPDAPEIRDIRSSEGIEDVTGPLEITPEVTIPAGELHWKFSQAMGRGWREGAHTESRVDLVFNPGRSRALDLDQRLAVLNSISGKLTHNGDLHIISDEQRSQYANRAVALRRLQVMLQDALQPHPERIPTRVPPGERDERLHEKHLTAQKGLLRHFTGLEAEGESPEME